MEWIFCDARENDLKNKKKTKTLKEHSILFREFRSCNQHWEWIVIYDFTVCACASLKSPLSMARIISHLAINIARCDFILPSSNSNVTSVNALDPIIFSKFFFTSLKYLFNFWFVEKAYEKTVALIFWFLPISNFERYHFVLPVAV